ncbi:MAG: histidine kinase [Phenylobacterium zucineum]|nr:MAG: histidine kinase [Phenylobacterium zucineum]
MRADSEGMEAGAAAQSAAPDFRTMFETLPSPHMVLDRSLNYVAVNAAYCQVLERRPEDMLGRNLFDAFPNPGEGGRRLRESLERVLETGRVDTIALIPYPIERPASRGGGFEMRYWSAAHVPLLDAEGRTQFIVQNTVDVTELQRLKAMAYGPGGEPAPGEKELLMRAQAAEDANRSLLRETQGLRDLFMQAPGFMAVLAGPEFRFALVNHAYQQLIGHRPVIGRPVAEALPEVAEQGFVGLLRGVMQTGQPFIGQGVSVHLRRTPDAPLEERFLDFIYQPITAPSGEVTGVFVEGADITERVLAERQQKLLLDELNHRVKNSLATVQAIAFQTLRSTPEPQHFREAFESRLLALAATHDLLTATSWRGAAMRDLLLAELRPYAPDQYQLSGPEVELAPRETLALGLVLHELATNAAKYGALSAPGGCVRVVWSLFEGRLDVEWREQDGPYVPPPTHRGFGSRLIERTLKEQLGGSARLDFGPGGLVCHIRLPLQEA